MASSADASDYAALIARVVTGAGQRHLRLADAFSLVALLATIPRSVFFGTRARVVVYGVEDA